MQFFCLCCIIFHLKGFKGRTQVPAADGASGGREAEGDTTGQTGPDMGSVWERSEQKDRDLLLGGKLKFRQELGTNPPMPAKRMQRGCRTLWGAVTHFPGKLARFFLWRLEWGINQEAEMSTGDQKQASAHGLF